MANATTNATSNAIQSIVTKEKQLYYNATNTNASVLDEAVELLEEKEVSFTLAANDANIGYTVPVGRAYQLTNAIFCTTSGIGNASANTVIFSISTNGVEVVNYNTESSTNVAAGGVKAFTVTTTNAFVDSGETIQVKTTTDEDADGAGMVVIRLRPVAHGS